MPRLGSGPLLAIGVVLGAVLAIFGAVTAGGYLAGAGDRSAYDRATSCGARDPQTADCRQDAAASVDAIVPVTSLQQNARSVHVQTTAWDVTLAMPGGDHTVRLSTRPSAMSDGDRVTAETWRGRITSVANAGVTYATDDSPDAYGDAPLAIGLGMAGAGLLLGGGSGVALRLRRRRAR